MRAVELDPTFALGHAACALVAPTRKEGEAVVETRLLPALAARQLSDRELSHANCILAYFKDPTPTLFDKVLTHVRIHPADALLASMGYRTYSYDPRPQMIEHRSDYVDGLASFYGDDWWYIGLLAFDLQERGSVAEALSLSSQALASEPRSGVAAHARTHALWQGGNNESGATWLSKWLGDYPRDGPSFQHLSFHLALHHFELHDSDAVAKLFFEDMVPCRDLSHVDGCASLLWRCYLDGTWAGVDAAFRNVHDDARAVLDRLPTVAASAHAGLLLAGADDLSGLARGISQIDKDPRPHFAGALSSFLNGVLAFVKGEYRRSIERLEPVLPYRELLGGGSAERDLVWLTYERACAEAS